VDGHARQFDASGNWVGGTLPFGLDFTTTDPLATSAVIWRQGSPVDLNSLTSGLPSTLIMTGALASNAKGQILAVANNKTGGNVFNKVKLVLLTPR
jgi:hypothetical protein